MIAHNFLSFYVRSLTDYISALTQPRMGNDLKCACRFSRGKEKQVLFGGESRGGGLHLFLWTMGAFKPAESLGTQIGIVMDWAVTEIVHGASSKNKNKKPFVFLLI